MLGKKIVAMAVATMMIFAGSVVAFAATDMGNWNSQIVYPQDVINTVHMTPVKFLMDKKVLTGDADGLFHPEKNITRAEFATMMAKATNNVNDLANMKTKNVFTDLAGYDWATGYINACAKANLINGVGNDKYAPAKEVTYAEVITVLIRSKNVSAVIGGTWPDNYIQYAQMNLNSMIGDRNITDWMAPANRGDVAMMLYRSMPKNMEPVKEPVEEEPLTPPAVTP